MRKSSGLLIAALLTLGLAALIAPASGQTAPPPEATPEYWPLVFDPSTVTVDPDAFTLVFEASARCAVSPDTSVAMLDGFGIYDLSTGAKRLGLAGRLELDAPARITGFSPVAPLVQIRDDGVYNYETGAKVIDTQYGRSGLFSPDGRWFVDYKVVYDLQTLEIVREINRRGDGIREYAYAEFLHDGEWLRYLNKRRMRTLDTSTWQHVEWEAAYDELLTREGATPLLFELIGIPGDGVYEAFTARKLFDVPDVGFMRMSIDGTLLAVVKPDEIVLYDVTSGSVRSRVAVFGAGNSILVSSETNTLVVPEYSEVRSDGALRLMPLSVKLYDIDTGQQRADISPASGEVWFLPDSRFIQIMGQGVYDATTGRQLAALAEGERATMTQDASMAFIVRRRNFTVLDPDTWTPRFTADGELTSVSPDRRYIMAGGVGVYDTANGALILETPGRRLVFTRDGRWLVPAAHDRCAVYRMPEN